MIYENLNGQLSLDNLARPAADDVKTKVLSILRYLLDRSSRVNIYLIISYLKKLTTCHLFITKYVYNTYEFQLIFILPVVVVQRTNL